MIERFTCSGGSILDWAFPVPREITLEEAEQLARTWFEEYRKARDAGQYAKAEVFGRDAWSAARAAFHANRWIRCARAA